MTTHDNPPLSTREAAARIGVSPAVLRSLARRGRIRSVRPTPNRYVFRARDVEEYIRAHTTWSVMDGERRTR